MFLNSISLKYKLATCFVLIVVINAISGLIGLGVIRDLGLLVNQTYDKALMAGTFAQAAKFNFSQYDHEIRDALLSTDKDSFDLHMLKSKKLFQTLKDDLKVVEERSLSPKSRNAILEISDKFAEIETAKISFLARKLKYGWTGEKMLSIEEEWRSNKKLKKIYRTLTSLYDDAAEVGYHFRLKSEAKIEENFKRTILMLSICLAVSLLSSILLSFTIIKPLRKLQSVCGDIAKGDFSVRSDIKGDDEFGTLSGSFNFMLKTIEEKTANMSTLLTALPFGLFYFDENGLISSERSKATDTLFKDFSKYSNLEDFFSENGHKVKNLSGILNALFEKMLPFNSAAFLLPQTIVVKKEESDQIIRLSYRPKMGPHKKLERVIMMGEDITEKENAKAEGIIQAERVERVSKISADIPGFKEFLISVRFLIEKSKTQGEDFARDLHSLKGLLGIYAYHKVALMVHILETDFDQNLFEKFVKGFEEQTLDVVNILDLQVDSNLKYVDENKMKKLTNLVSESENSELKAAIQDLDRFPIEKAFSKYSVHASTLALSYEDKDFKIIFDPSDEISFREVQRLDSVFIHVLNNSIDHGIETTEERSLKNKKPSGSIHISFKRLPDDSLRFRIADDGKGIDGDLLLEKAIEKGLLSESESKNLKDNEKMNLIFKSGLSTKESASMISGRGIGMDAVKSFLESLGGSINLNSAIDIGTTFELIIPPVGSA
jgi:HAMP domain-containing protein/two-component sensor histidine kinase